MRRGLIYLIASLSMLGSAGTKMPSPCPQFSGEVESAIKIISEDKGLGEEALLRSIIQQESGGRKYALSPAGATGLMQIMPIAIREIQRQEKLMKRAPRPWTKDVHKFNTTCSVPREMMSSLYVPVVNVYIGSCYLLLTKIWYGGNMREMLIAYNGGHYSVMRWRKGLPIFKETHLYYQKVEALYRSCRKENR